MPAASVETSLTKSQPATEKKWITKLGKKLSENRKKKREPTK